MILLTGTAHLLQIVTASSVALDAHASYMDLNGSTVTPIALNVVQITGTTTTTLVGSPASSTQRAIKYVSIRNTHASSSNQITIQHSDGTTTSTMLKMTLLAGYTLSYNDVYGWEITDAGGAPVITPLAGRFLKRTVILNGTTTFTTGPATNSIVARMVAGGGQGGGGIATTGCNGAGGGAGSYAEWAVNVTPNTGYTCAVGAGGTTGGTGVLGQTGGVTTLAIGGTTVTCNAGVGGAVGASISVPVLGGAGGVVSTNGTLNATGGAGGISVCTGTALNNASGKGADSQFGGGGAAKLNASATTGAAAGGFGAGGGGGTTTGTATAGGAGSAGVIIIDEYS